MGAVILIEEGTGRGGIGLTGEWVLADVVREGTLAKWDCDDSQRQSEGRKLRKSGQKRES